MKQLAALYNEYFLDLTEIERSIFQYVLNHPEEVAKISITDLASQTLTSRSSVLRLTQKIGFSGFTEFKFFISNELKLQEDLPRFDNNLLKSDLEATEKLFYQGPIDQLNQLLFDANQIFCYGSGMGQRNVLRDLRRNLINAKKFTVDIPDTTELKLAVEAAKPNDLMIVLSLSGDVPQIADQLALLKSKNVNIIGITRLRQSILTNFADYLLYFQTTSRYYQNKEIVSFLPIFYLTELIFEHYFDYYMDQKEENDDSKE